MSSSLWTFTVPATSPMFTYLPFTGNVSTGWQTLCTAPVGPTRCDEHTAHVTSVHSSVSLAFNGTGIALYGNMTASISLTATLEDGTKPNQDTDSSMQLLAGFSGLPQGSHNVTLMIESSSPAARLYFTEAIVSIDTGIPEVDATSVYIDDTDPSITYDVDWYSYPAYAGTITPEGISNASFHASMVAGATASLRFNGNAVFLYGPCYAVPLTGPYRVQVSPLGIDLYLNTTNPDEDVHTDIMESCLRFFATSLDPMVEMEITTQSLVNGQWDTLDYVQVVGFQPPAGGLSAAGFSSGVSSTEGSPTSSPSTSSTGTSIPTYNATSPSSSHTGAIVGSVVGGGFALLIAILATFIICIRRSRAGRKAKAFRRGSCAADETASDEAALEIPLPAWSSVTSNGSIESISLSDLSNAALHHPSVHPPSTQPRTSTSASVISIRPAAPARGSSLAPAKQSSVSAPAPLEPLLVEITSELNRLLGQLARLGGLAVRGEERHEGAEEPATASGSSPGGTHRG